MARNTELLKTIARSIAASPDRYDQLTWGKAVGDKPPTACGTAHCIAGHAVVRHPDYEPVWVNVGTIGNLREFTMWDARHKGRRHTMEVGVAARRALGLKPKEAFVLFYEGWKPADDLTPAQALNRLAKGAAIEDVTHAQALDDALVEFEWS